MILRENRADEEGILDLSFGALVTGAYDLNGVTRYVVRCPDDGDLRVIKVRTLEVEEGEEIPFPGYRYLTTLVSPGGDVKHIFVLQ